MFPRRRYASALGLSTLLASVALVAGVPAGAVAAPGSAHGKTSHVPGDGLDVDLDEADLSATLPVSPERGGRRAHPATVELPLGPRGEPVAFVVEPSSTLSPGLRERFPTLGAYVGTAPEHEDLRVRLERGPSGGFTAGLYAGTELVRILEHVRAGKGGGRTYSIYTPAGEDRHDRTFACTVFENGPKAAVAGRSAGSVGDCRLRRYRLAVATTGEYARAVGGPDPELSTVLAEVNVAVNRVNEVFERDLGITFELVAESAELISLDPERDPFAADSSSDIALARRNQEVVDSVLGGSAYDVGHLFHAPTAGPTGLALRRMVCRDNSKAVALTGTPQPRDERFYIDYFAHELGHQFGASHTANNECGGQRNASTAYEPGSGSTIMGYAGVCAPNVQPRSDDYFHAASIAEVGFFLADLEADCATLVPRDNTRPTVEAAADGLLTVPVATPFALTAVGSDAERGGLTYTWEQFDAGADSPTPPGDTNATGPLFRSLAPSGDPIRRFPAGAPPEGDFPGFEVLPAVARELNFRVTVRDNDPGVGCTNYDELRLLVTDEAGPFRVTSFAGPDTLRAGQQVVVEWDVAGTSTGPVGVELVDVALSVDGGRSDSLIALAATPNDGVATVTVPEVVTDSARWVVRARGNVFFAVSGANLRVEPAVEPGFSIAADTTAVATCGSSASYQLDLESVGGFDEPIALSVVGLPVGAAVTLSRTTGTGSFSSALALELADTLAAGNYGFRVVAEAGTSTRSLELTLQRRTIPSNLPGIIRPTDGSDVAGPVTAISWSGQTGDSAIRVEIAPSADFPPASTVVREVVGQGVELPGLAGGVYFVRLAYVNDCGRGPWTPIRSFRQLGLERFAFSSTGDVEIGRGGPNVATSELNVTRAGTVYDLQVSAQIEHSYVGDLTADLVLPRGDTVALFGRVNEGDCDGSDLAVAFADSAAQTLTASLGVCGAGTPAVDGTFQPLSPFARELPREAVGTYTLVVTDNAQNDGGVIREWAVALQYARAPNDSLTLVADTLGLLPGRARVVTAEVLRAIVPGASPDELAYVVKRLPEVGSFSLGGREVTEGGSFTQAAVDAGELVFAHQSGEARGRDALVLDVLGPGGAYQSNARLPVDVAASTLAARLSAVRTITCAGAADAAVEVVARGGTPPYRFRFNGGAFAESSLLSGLAPGTYVATVRDALGSEASTGSVVVEEPTPLTLEVGVEADVVNASSAGGTPPLQYRLGSGELRAQGLFADVADGEYVVEVRDANGCTETAQVVIATTPALRLSVEVFDEIDCAGQTGVIRAVGAGGEPPYGFSLDGGPAQRSGLFEEVSGGGHVIVATDAEGRQAEQSVTLLEPDPLTLAATASGRTVTVAASGGTAPYRFRLGGGTYGDGAFFEELPDGTYAVAVRDRAGCEAFAEVVVAGPSSSPVVTGVTQLTEVSCAGDADARVVAAARAGTPPYDFELADGTRAGAAGVFGGLPAGEYAAIAIDSLGIRSTPFPFTVGEPGPLSLAAEVSGSRVRLEPSGGTPPYSYLLDGQPGSPDPAFGPLAAGTYRFTARDANGCTASVVAALDDAGLDVNVALTLARESCPGSADGAVTLRGVGGVAPYSYSLDGQGFRTVDFFGGLAPGPYTAYVRDALGNTATNEFEIGARAPFAYETDVLGSRVTVSGGGTGPRPSYSFDGGLTFGPDSTGYVYAEGSAEVVVRVEGCEARVGVVVANPLTLNSAPVANCGGAGPIALALCVGGGGGGYRLASDAGEVRSEPSTECPGSFEVAVPAGRSLVTVTLEDSTGASIRREIAIPEASPFAVTIEVDDEALTAIVDHGTPPFTYQLNDGAPQSSPEFDATALGDSVTVTVRDSVGCTVTRSFSTSSLGDPRAQTIGMRLFPNPTSGAVQVQFADGVEVESVSVFDLTGRIVAAERLGVRGQPAGGGVELDLADLPTGTYQVRLRHRGGMATTVVVKR